MSKTTTFEQIIARELLAGRRVLPALRREARAAIGEECPECGMRDTESNGGTEYRCCACDHRWGFDNGERYGF